MHQNCPVCQENLFNSTSECRVCDICVNVLLTLERWKHSVRTFSVISPRKPVSDRRCLSCIIPKPEHPPSQNPTHNPTVLRAQVLRCGHTMHRDCLRSLMTLRQPLRPATCPLCNVSIMDNSIYWSGESLNSASTVFFRILYTTGLAYFFVLYESVFYILLVWRRRLALDCRGA
jgi:hypothetical protein